jgi:predicted enzyme related to lactoylglutathione lyase
LSTPTSQHGKVCYIEIPTDNVQRSATFYQTVFQWNVRLRGDGATAFDDTLGEVSGAWVTGRPPSPAPGLLIYIMVDDAQACSEAIVQAGGEIVEAIDPDFPEIIARFRDPFGNVLGIYQEPVQPGESA